MANLVEVVEGWTDPIELQLLANGAELNLVGKQVALILIRKDGTVIDTSSPGKLLASDALTGKMKFFPTSTDLVASQSPYQSRWHVIDGAVQYFLPNTRTDLWQIFARTESDTAPNALIDIHYLKTMLAAYEQSETSADEFLLARLIDSTSDKIERYCKRTFKAGDFLKREQWNGCINLTPYPIQYVQGIYRETRAGFTLTNAAANKDRASAWITENRKLYLEVAGGGSDGLQSINLTLPTNDTLGELVSAINGLSGNWTAAIATGRTGYERSEDLLAGFAGRRVLESGLTFSLLGEALTCEYELIEESGILKDLRTAYPLSNYRFEGNPVWIKFRGGYDAIPEDLKAITARICQFFYAESKRDPGLASERIGDYSYNRYNTETSQQLDLLPSNLKRELDLWIDHSR